MQLAPDPLDHAQPIFAVPHDHDAAHDLAPAVQLGDATAQLGTQLDSPDVAHAQRRSLVIGLDRDLFKIVATAQVAATAGAVAPKPTPRKTTRFSGNRSANSKLSSGEYTV